MIDNILVMASVSKKYFYPWVAAICRPIILTFYFDKLKDSILRYILVGYDARQIVGIILLYVFYFSWFGLQLFEGTLQGIS